MVKKYIYYSLALEKHFLFPWYLVHVTYMNVTTDVKHVAKTKAGSHLLHRLSCGVCTFGACVLHMSGVQCGTGAHVTGNCMYSMVTSTVTGTCSSI